MVRVAIADAVELPRASPVDGDGAVDLAVLLDRGGLLAVPTESSYGFAADPRSVTGVAAIYQVKIREANRPLPVVVAGRSQIVALGVDPALPELALAERLWPGPVTVVLPIAHPLPATAGETTIAVRVPGHPGLRRLLERLGRPLTATSANRSGEPPELEPEGAGRVLDLVRTGTRASAVVIDGGILPGGPPSTIVRLRAGRAEILREGVVSPAEIARRLKV